MHSIQVILGGFALWTTLLLGRSMFDLRIGDGTLCVAFCVMWLAVSSINLAMGMRYAGYSLGEELPFFLLVLSVPVIAVVTTVMMLR